VDPDKRPSHLFRTTKTDRLCDAFDRFDRRLYAASSQIGAEPFHDTCECAAGSRPEYPTELAQAHASRFRQSLDGSSAAMWSRA